MNMKKIVLSMFVGCMVIFGCSSCTVDKGHTTYYTYVNQTIYMKRLQSSPEIKVQ